MENKNPFSEILEGGYILSEETKCLLLELSESFNVNSDFFERAKLISLKYNYEKRIYLVFLYLDYALADNLISKDEFLFVQNLKKSFSIIPGDFFTNNLLNIQRILAIQFHLYYLDNEIDFEESQEIGYLQEIFDLDATQITSFELMERRHQIFSDISRPQEKQISEMVKREVWERDGGKCALCGSTLSLKFDHYIPISQGGSATVDNIRIICKDCNKKN